MKKFIEIDEIFENIKNISQFISKAKFVSKIIIFRDDYKDEYLEKDIKDIKKYLKSFRNNDEYLFYKDIKILDLFLEDFEEDENQYISYYILEFKIS